MSIKDNGWQVKFLGEVVGKKGLMIDGDWVESKDQDPKGEIRLIQLADVGDSKYLNVSKRFLTKEKAEELKCTYLHQGDVLIARMPDPLGRACIFPGDEKTCVTVVDVCIVRADKSIADNKFLMYKINTSEFRNALKKYISGTTRARISRSNLEKIKIEIPPLPIQKQIAEILEKADEAKQKRKEANKLTDEFLQSVFIEMFGDPVKNPKGWEKIKLEQLSEIRRGASPRPIDKFLGGTVPWIKIGDGTKGNEIYIEETTEKVTEEGAMKSVLLKEGSLIFANCGVSLGFARILKIKGCIHDGWLALENINDKLNKIFLLKLINALTYYFQSIAPEGTQPNLNTGIMKNFEVILPPISLQQQFAEIVNKTEALKEKQKQSEQELENLFQSLMQKAFKGELVG